jgi:hypothetical protein
MIAVHVPGPWVVDNTLPKHWAIFNTHTKRRRVIGPINARRINYFDRAMREAERRNSLILNKEVKT